MNLFREEKMTNILPFDGAVMYHGKVFDSSKADYYLDRLLHQIDWMHDEAFMFGKLIITDRKVAWYGDHDFSYHYSNISKRAMPWSGDLLELKRIAGEITRSSFNSCLLNLYHDGTEGVGWHSDDEKSLTKNAAIASISFGAKRKFSFKHKNSKEVKSIWLEHGSLLVMEGTTQTHWLHCIPKSIKIKRPRVNLTFRSMVVN